MMFQRFLSVTAIKAGLQTMPWFLGRAVSRLPYQYRPGIGSAYSAIKRSIQGFDALSIDQQKRFILQRSLESIEFAFLIPFFKEFYRSHGISLGDIQSFDDLSSLPIVTKEMLKEHDIEQRSRFYKGRYKTNTGGTSGSPLSFYITPELIPNEWAHMHTIWGKLGFSQNDLKLVFSGRNLGSKAISYDGLRHSYAVNAYRGFDEIRSDLRAIIQKKGVKYLHGYPSAIAEFGRNISEFAPDLLLDLRKNLEGVFLGSEYPAPAYRSIIEDTFRVPTVSWYGHTERAVLAWEKGEPFLYHPFQTYGFTEGVKNEETGGWRLVSTTYYNRASPFIRYDTGDEIEPVLTEGGILRSFRITSGRVGDYVIDRSGVKLSLTALIFGRHHQLFEIARFVQVRQVRDGHATIVITPNTDFPSGFDFEQWFDTASLNMVIDYVIVEQPILSNTGKVLLKITQ